MRLYDTLSRRKRDFRPLKGNTVRIYTCGPSVYSYSHIGNFRTYLFEDVLVRYLRFKGYGVKRVMNITDVEDKAIIAARKEGVTLAALQKDKIRRFFADFDYLGMLRPDVVAKASGHVPDMIGLVTRICRNGYCLKGDGNVYFNVRKFRRYGRLARLAKRAYFGRAKGDDYVKEGLWDFILWKGWTRGDGGVKWHSPFGDGRPGWHIECSAMSMRYLGETFDIHCGGTDNIFPHHENEIAQGYAAAGRLPARFWLHAKHLTVNRKKMSKRTGNVLYVVQLAKEEIHPKCLRFYLISERYRHPLDFTWAWFMQETCHCEHAEKLLAALHKVKGPGDGRRGQAIARRMLDGFEGAMDDDLNTKLAFKRIFTIFRNVDALLKAGKLTANDANAIIAAMKKINSVLGVF
ncbi:MAG: cysteine--tRNA ligase [Candidatus ainarchaeum sp.]|nr:cysteine--tRNA ligase [Candidatus ainarchaeum sp.]